MSIDFLKEIDCNLKGYCSVPFSEVHTVMDLMCFSEMREQTMRLLCSFYFQFGWQNWYGMEKDFNIEQLSAVSMVKMRLVASARVYFFPFRPGLRVTRLLSGPVEWSGCGSDFPPFPEAADTVTARVSPSPRLAPASPSAGLRLENALCVLLAGVV